MSEKPVAVSATNLAKIYSGRQGTVEALRDVTLDIPQGAFVSLVGPSGCGKSTLLNLLAGLIERSGGSIRVRGTPIDGPQRDIGVVFQNAVLLPWKTTLPCARPQRRRAAQCMIRAGNAQG